MARTMIWLKNFPKLHFIDLSFNKWVENDFYTFTILVETSPSLKRLDFSACDVTKQTMQDLLKLLWTTKALEVSLALNPTLDGDIEVPKLLTQATHLVTLNLSGLVDKKVARKILINPLRST